MTEQDIFNRAWDRFITKQAPLSVTNDGRSAYRGANGAVCTVGMFIDDHEHADGLTTVAEVCAKVPRLAPFKSVLAHLQRAHDAAVDGADLRAELELVARRRDLVVPA